MKNLNTVSSLILIVVIFIGNIGKTACQENNSYNLNLEILNFKNNSGNVLLSLLDNNKKVVINRKCTISNEKVSITFKNLQKGEYAIQMYHDENSNGKMDNNVFGIPSEGYAFSNNGWARFGEPSFENQLFTVKNDTSIIIKMEYYW